MRTYKVLVCDDEPHIVHVVSAKLRNNGFEVVTAADGEEAFATAMAESPDLVITDYQMPYLSGLELCARLRSEDQTSRIPVIMLTARGFSLDSDDTKDTNIRKVLPKPFSPREVLSCVHQILGEPATAAASSQ